VAYVSSTNCDNETSNVEPSVDKTLCFSITLNVSDIDLYDSHIGFGEHLDYSWFRGQDNIIEDVVAL